MKLQIDVDLQKLMGKAKEIDLVKLLQIYQDLNEGKEVQFFDGQVKVKKL